MGALGVWALAIGVADIVAPVVNGASRDGAARAEVLRLRLAAAALVVVAVIGGVAVGLPFIEVALLTGVVVVSGGAWLWLWDRDAQRIGLAVLSGAFVLLVVTAGTWSPGESPLSRFLRESPFVPLAGTDHLILIVGLAFLLVATGNRIVRVLLTQVEHGLLGQEQQLKGGRVIGPLERVLIFGLGISGQMVAAGLVVTAKSLLRFSELRHRGEHRDVDAPARAELMSEYLLVGSLLSWALAFAAIGLVAAASS